MFEFNFGPISRTVDASTRRGDAINLASLPLHEAITALLAANNRNEFVAWLWHDLFKPLFWWPQRNKWFHVPNNKRGDPLNFEQHWAQVTGTRPGLVATHHKSRPVFTYAERGTINNEFDQVAIGTDARFIQLSFLAEPATHTALLRAVIADAFMEVVTKAVARAIKTELAKVTPAFRRTRYIFKFCQIGFSNPPTNGEIAKAAAQYSIKPNQDVLSICHIVPVSDGKLNGQRVKVVIDLTPKPPMKKRFDQGIVSLVELLTVYQDSRTILMGIPQFLSVDVQQLEREVRRAAKQRLCALDIRTLAGIEELKMQTRTQQRVDWTALPLQKQGNDVDLLAHVFKEQAEIRLVHRGMLVQQFKDKGNNTFGLRLLSDITARPLELLRTKSRRCRFCNTAFDSVFPEGESTVGNDFTDVEHIGFGGDICPMCRVYRLNSHKSRTAAERAQGITGDRKGYRGAFALVMPSSHFTYQEGDCRQIERPPLDVGGRFANPLQRATVTLQEFNLFNMISRRIIAELWAALDDANSAQPLPLPYLGAILFTQDQGKQVRELFEKLEALFESVELVAYPFRVTIQPAVELAFEMAVNDLKQHHTKHTYLKTSPIVVPVAPESKFTLLVDNGLQLEVSWQFFQDRRRMDELLGSIEDPKRRRSWLLGVLQGEDPLTAAVDSFSDGKHPLWSAERFFWDAQLGTGDITRQWQKYEEVRGEVQNIISKYPLLIEFFVKPRRR